MESNNAIGMMQGNVMSGPAPVAIERAFKDNSGTLEDWRTFSYEVVALPEVPMESKVFYDRDGTMMLMNKALAPEVHMDAGALVMRPLNQFPSFFSTVDSPARLDDPSGDGQKVILVKMWGFAGMHDAEEMLPHYSKGVDALLKMSSFTGALMTNAHIVLHFDGDAAYEKKEDKFSHNLFAPFVAKMIKVKTGNKVPVHLVVTKVDKLDPANGETLLTMVGKFCNTDNGFATCNFRTEETAGAHWYPYFDRRFFDSAALYVSETGEKSTGSEGQNSVMMEQLFNGRVVARFCLGIGGNTKAPDFKTKTPGGGVVSMQQFIRNGKAFPFNGAVRVNVAVTR